MNQMWPLGCFLNPVLENEDIIREYLVRVHQAVSVNITNLKEIHSMCFLEFCLEKQSPHDSTPANYINIFIFFSQ